MHTPALTSAAALAAGIFFTPARYSDGCS